MKYLTDKEILNWNKRLDKSGYMVYPSPNRRSSEPDISYRQIVKNGPGIGDTFVETTEPFIRYKFTFSVASNRKETFFEIFNRIAEESFGTKSIYQYDDHNNIVGKSEKVTSIEFNDSIIDSKSESNHMISEKEYTRFTYNFAGKLGSIMAFISYLEDTINIFSMMWGYENDGSEVSLLKYPIGTIVSPKDDKSKDLLILDYKFSKIYDKYYIDYYASEMLTTGTVITYGNSEEYKEENLCFSRNNRIDNILN